jgi:hypothetical protein
MLRNEELLTSEQLAKIIKVSGFTVEDWRRKGVIPHFWLGHRTIRYRLSDVIAALEQAAGAAEAQQMRAEQSQRGRIRAKSLHKVMAVRKAEEGSSVCTRK